ncbi:MAG: glutathione S-transferase N-terminal domain-containing protein [Gammaproteobacteria bacterium]
MRPNFFVNTPDINPVYLQTGGRAGFRVRLVLAAKGVVYDLIPVDPQNPPEDLVDLNPYHSVPTLVERDLVLYAARVIMEYLDERFPHPPLMPVDPVSRAKARLAMHRIDHDWYSLLTEIESKGEKNAGKAKKTLRDSIASTAEVFAALPYFISEEFSLVDCYVAPLLWRLPHYHVDLPKQAKPVLDYAERIFRRESFKLSLTEAEREMRE